MRPRVECCEEWASASRDGMAAFADAFSISVCVHSLVVFPQSSRKMVANSAGASEAMPEPVVGLIGCGNIGRFHSRNIRGVQRSELVPLRYVAVADQRADRARAFADITGAAYVFESAAELLETPGLNAVYVCTETAEHPAIVQAAVQRGLHIFCEKPLARTLPEVREMVERVEKAGVVNQVGLILRTSPVLNVLADMMSDPQLGTLLTAHLRDDQFFPIRGHYNSTWRGEFERAGGGTLIEHSIHDVDVFRWLFGEIATVRCHTRYVSGHEGIEDVALVTFQHTGGHVTTLSSVWHDMGRRGSTRRLEVFFERGWFATDHDFLGPIEYQLGEGERQTLPTGTVMDRFAALRGLDGAERRLAEQGMYADYAFLCSIHDASPAFPGFRTALKAHTVVDACYRSAAAGMEVAVSVEV
jgi:predicted dehydrogenase